MTTGGGGGVEFPETCHCFARREGGHKKTQEAEEIQEVREIQEYLWPLV